jgi:hypothetical protein
VIKSVSVSSIIDVKMLDSIIVSRTVLPATVERTVTGNDVVNISVMSEVAVETITVGTMTEVVEIIVTSSVSTLNVGTKSVEMAVIVSSSTETVGTKSVETDNTVSSSTETVGTRLIDTIVVVNDRSTVVVSISVDYEKLDFYPVTHIGCSNAQ